MFLFSRANIVFLHDVVWAALSLLVALPIGVTAASRRGTAVDTGLIGRKQEALTRIPSPDADVVAAAALAASGVEERPVSNDPWSALAGYAHFHAMPKRVRLTFGEAEIAAGVSVAEGRWSVAVDAGASLSPTGSAALTQRHTSAGTDRLPLARWPGHVTVFDGAAGYTFTVPDPLASGDEAAAGTGSLRAPMPGLVKVVRVAAGEHAAKGQPLLILEAMKMETPIMAGHDGVIASFEVTEGMQIQTGALVALIKHQ